MNKVVTALSVLILFALASCATHDGATSPEPIPIGLDVRGEPAPVAAGDPQPDPDGACVGLACPPPSRPKGATR